jgi:hypothetical protein
MNKRKFITNSPINFTFRKKFNVNAFFIGFLMIYCVPGLTVSKKWKEFHSSKSAKMFYEAKSLRGNSVKQIVVMLNFNIAQKTSDGKKVKSIRMIQNYDCTTSRFRLRSAINYSDQLLKGEEVSRGNEVTPWRVVPDGTPYNKLMQKICK